MRARVVSLALGGSLLCSLALGAPPAAAQTASAGNVNLRMVHFPEGATKARAVIAVTSRGIASGWANGAPFKGLANRIQAAIVIVGGGDDLNDPSYPNRCASGEFNGIPMAMTKLGEASNHPEFANTPLIGVGHSHGGDYWNWFNACHPERMAMVFVHASGGVNYSAASLKVPVLYELGTGDLIENGSKKPRAGMFANRAKGAPMALVIGQGEGHNNVTADSLAMVIDIIEATVKLRIPADADPAKGPVKLNAIDEMSGRYWLGNLYTKEVAPYGMYMGDKALTAFLPNEQVAMKWKGQGPGLPMSIVLPRDTCSWCGNPKDEPRTSDNNPDPGTNASPGDAGPPPPPSNPDPSPPDAATSPPPPSNPTGGAGGSSMTPPPSNPTPTPPSNPTPTPRPPAGQGNGTGSGGGTGNPAGGMSVSGGCSLGGDSPGAPAVLLLGLALVLAGRRRRR
jgi:MYXO-CTERM domain-containing protein